MSLQKRFAKYKSKATLTASARNWARTYREGRSLSNRLIKMEVDVATLVSICKQLDAAAFDEAPFDYARARGELASIRRRIDGLTPALSNYSSDLKRYSDVTNAATQFYQSQSFKPNPDLFIGPDPAKISQQLQTLNGRWRVIAADFKGQISPNIKIDVRPERDADMINLATQAQILANTIKQARSINAAMIPDTTLNEYVSGAHLYKLCPIEDGKAYKIENTFFKGRFLIDENNKVKTMSESSFQWRVQSTLLEPGRRWSFKKAGAGFWTLQSGQTKGSNRILDNGGLRVYTMKSPQAKNTLYTGQAWRCYNTRWPNAYRFSNATWSEERSIDASANGTMTMSPTGPFGGQLWLIKGLTPAPDTPKHSAENGNQFCLTAHNGVNFVVSEANGQSVNANRKACGPWEKHNFVDINGGDLVSGDYVYVYSHHGKLWSAQPNGTLQANRTAKGAWEKFQIFKKAGGTIRANDSIGLKGAHSKWVVAESGGGKVVKVNRPAQGAWETFKLSTP